MVHKPTDADRLSVLRLAGCGVPHERIKTILGVSLMTMKKHYADELERGRIELENQLINNMFRFAQGDDKLAFDATKYLLACRFGWSQYVPAPKELGKKDAANMEAQIAHQGNEWGDLIDKAERLQ